MGQPKSTLLICTVGGSPEPVVAALKHWRPARVCFVHTPQTKSDVEGKILSAANQEGLDLDPGRYDLFELPDGQDLAACADRLRQLTPEVEQWAARGEGYQVAVDFTGGTKCMSAAIALHARRWPCLFSYVGGAERTKEGVGVVVSGSEKVLFHSNPWDALGYQAVEDFVVLFDQHAFAAAARAVATAKVRTGRPDRARELSALEQLGNAMDAWDRFDHRGAQSFFGNVKKGGNDLRGALGPSRANEILEGVSRCVEHLDDVVRVPPPSRNHFLDLLANARRRRDEGRIDDGVARLYRAIEALAQTALKDSYGIDETGKIPIGRIPEPLRLEWAPRSRAGLVRIGLQEAYVLLGALGDPLGKRFREAGLDSPESCLNARNCSIMAHGFERAPLVIFDRLWDAALALAGVQPAAVPAFPKLGRQQS